MDGGDEGSGVGEASVEAKTRVVIWGDLESGRMIILPRNELSLTYLNMILPVQMSK